jgi:hypothetical protein
MSSKNPVRLRVAALSGVIGLAQLLAGCGGGADAQAPAATVRPQALAQVQPQALAAMTAAQRNVALLHQGAYGRAPSNATYTSSSALAASDLNAMVIGVNNDLAALDDATLARRVLANLGVTAKSVTAPGAVDAMQAVLPQLFAAYGKASRAAVLLNAATLLSSLEADPTWGGASRLLNLQVTANHAYSADATHLVSHAVTPGGTAASNLPVYGDCLNPALYAPGASYQVSIAAPGLSSLVVSTTVGKRVNFHGTETADLAQTVNGVNTAGQSTELNYHYYHDVTDAGFVDAGLLITLDHPLYGTIVIDTYYTPVSRIAATLGTTGSYSESVTVINKVLVSALPDIPTEKSFNVFSFQGVEQLTTPAGTFAACKRRVTRTSSSSSADTIWTVADGRLKGLQLKFVDKTGAAQTTTQLVLNGSSLP